MNSHNSGGVQASNKKSSFLARYTALPKALFLLSALVITTPLFAQEEASGANFEGWLVGIFAFAMILLILVVVILTDKLLKFSAVRATGSDTSDGDEAYSIIPDIRELFPRKGGKYSGTAPVKKLKKGFDIKIRGKAQKQCSEYHANTYAIKPIDFLGIRPIPKLVVNEGDEVKAGDPVFFDKQNPEILYTAPVSGEVVEVKRGEKRSITEVVILADKETSFKEFPKENPANMQRMEVVLRLKESGCWPYLISRPFGLVADPEVTPRDIFISGFDSAPLAADLSFAMEGQEANFQAGIDALSVLTDGKIHLSLDAKRRPANAFTQAKGIVTHWFDGPHPAGNVGIQIHHIQPIAKGEVVWTISPQHVAIIGRLLLEGKYDPQVTVAVAGSSVKKPAYVKTRLGASVDGLIENNLETDHVRLISGNVLTGKSIGKKGHLGTFDNVLSVIEEGDQPELLGWLVPSYPRPSISNTFPWKAFPDEEFEVNTNTNGEPRAFVVTGQYESVLPMDMLPVHLLKSIMYRDFEQMEGLGIYEVLEEDLALCEFVCTSKTHVQEILREGLEYVREQA